jgi:PTS system nitrogen regulatory IIA component
MKTLGRHARNWRIRFEPGRWTGYALSAENTAMAATDFDIVALAEYLHLRPEQVAKMADRGQLPGRRISGEWRFSLGDIHHWLEERIGASDEEQLVAIESAFERNRDVSDEDVRVSDLLTTEAIALPLEARTRVSVISEMISLAGKTGWLWDPERMESAVKQRESLHPTALDNGVALLHPRRPLTSILAQSFLALGRTNRGIPFGHPRGVLTDIFFLIAATDDRIHLRILARLSRLVSRPEVLEEIRTASDPRELLDCLRQLEQQTLDS